MLLPIATCTEMGGGTKGLHFDNCGRRDDWTMNNDKTEDKITKFVAPEVGKLEQQKGLASFFAKSIHKSSHRFWGESCGREGGEYVGGVQSRATAAE